MQPGKKPRFERTNAVVKKVTAGIRWTLPPYGQTRAFHKLLFEKPIEYTTTNGQKVRILHTGFANPHQKTKRHHPVVFVIVNGRLLQFYQSTGEASDRPGDWLPTLGIKTTYPKVLGTRRGEFINFAGHPNFPPWVEEIAGRIRKAQVEKQLRLQPKWNLETYIKVLRILLKRHRRSAELKEYEH